MRAAAIIGLTLALAGCAPVPAVIRPSDAVKTEVDAIRLAIKACGDVVNIPPNWSARLDGDTWIVRNEKDRHTYVENRIRKNDGYDDGKCDVAVTAD